MTTPDIRGRTARIAMVAALVLTGLLTSSWAAHADVRPPDASQTAPQTPGGQGGREGPPDIDIWDSPDAVAVSPDHRWAYVNSTSEGAISVIDLSKHALAKVIHLGRLADPQGVAFSRDGRLAFVPDEGTDSVSVIDVAHQEVTQTVGHVGSRPVAVAVGGSGDDQVLVANLGDDTVSIFPAPTDPSQAPQIRRVHLADFPEPQAVVATGSAKAYVASTYDGRIDVLDISKAAVTGRLVRPDHNPTSAATIAPNGQTAVLTGPGSTALLDVGKDTFRTVEALEPGNSSGAAVTSDSRYALVVNQGAPESYQQGTMAVIDLSTGAVVRKVGAGTTPSAVAVVPASAGSDDALVTTGPENNGSFHLIVIPATLWDESGG
ncbi:YncE family protein [Streptomyces sp. NPDC058251]|uniref:YncE family protein n=2 Tax=Streptomyces TaxID=1883 RepID=UPI00364EF46B